MVAKKKASKRLTVRQMHKVKTKVSEARRKARKNAKKNPPKFSKSKRDPGIPNLFPLKEKILLKAQQMRELASKKGHGGPTASLGKGSVGVIEELDYADAACTASGSAVDDFERTSRVRSGAEHQRAYYRELNRLIEKSDVVLAVVDARDPLGTRPWAVEEMLRSAARAPRIVLLLNKADLVPRDVLANWLTLLRRELPTVAFKAHCGSHAMATARGGTSTGDGARRRAPSPSRAAPGQLASAGETLGIDAIMHLLKNYARSTSGITVGVVGYPNVGKSSLINSLRRSRVCAVGATPGITKTLQEVVLDRGVRLIDCPGIVFEPLRPGMPREEVAAIALRNCVRTDALEDPVLPVEVIVSRVPVARLAQIYDLPKVPTAAKTGDLAQMFLAMVARARGKLLKGGAPDVIAAARMVILDWNNGRIPYYTMPPSSLVAAPAGERVIVDSAAPAIDLSKLDQELMRKLPAQIEGAMEIEFNTLSSVYRVDDVDLAKVKPEIVVAGCKKPTMSLNDGENSAMDLS